MWQVKFGPSKTLLPLPDAAVDVALSSTVFEEGNADLMLSKIVRALIVASLRLGWLGSDTSRNWSRSCPARRKTNTIDNRYSPRTLSKGQGRADNGGSLAAASRSGGAYETAALPCADNGADSGHSLRGVIPMMAWSTALARPAKAQISARVRSTIAAGSYWEHAEGGM